MPWFKVDDGLHAHRKAVRAGVPAMGLWVLAGSWSADQLTDGWVPDYIAARLDSEYREHAAALVRCGLWFEGEQDGDEGWWFHDWPEHQPSRADVEAKREAARERMRRVREQRASRSEDVRANSEGTSQEVRLTPTRPDPTRPIPELPSEVHTSLASLAPQRADKPRGVSDDDPQFAAFWKAYPRRADKGHARKAWTAAIKKADPDAIVAAAEKFAVVCERDRTEPRFIAMPATWLNGERWTDEAPRRLAAVVNGNRHTPYRDPTDMSVYTEGL